MKKQLTTLIALAVLLTIGWIGPGAHADDADDARDISAKSLCDHAWDHSTEEEREEGGGEAAFKEGCTESVDGLKGMATEESFEAFAGCILDAEKKDDARECGKKLVEVGAPESK